MLLATGFVLIQNSWVQTIITRKITQRLSNDLQTNISIGRVDIGFFNRLKLEDVLIEDQMGDTLIYSEQVEALLPSALTRKLKLKALAESFDIQI